MNGYKCFQLNLKNKIIASFACFLAAISVLACLIVVPTIKEIKSMGESIEAQREDLERKYIKGQSLRKLTDNLSEIEPRLKSLDQIFINKNRELEFITGLENEASKNGVSQKINLSAPEKIENQNFQKTKIQLFTKGSFIKQLQYLLSLEHLNYYINVNLLELSPAAGDGQVKTDKPGLPPAAGETNNLNMYIDADTYWN